MKWWIRLWAHPAFGETVYFSIIYSAEQWNFSCYYALYVCHENTAVILRCLHTRLSQCLPRVCQMEGNALSSSLCIHHGVECIPGVVPYYTFQFHDAALFPPVRARARGLRSACMRLSCISLRSYVCRCSSRSYYLYLVAALCGTSYTSYAYVATYRLHLVSLLTSDGVANISYYSQVDIPFIFGRAISLFSRYYVYLFIPTPTSWILHGCILIFT